MNLKLEKPSIITITGSENSQRNAIVYEVAQRYKRDGGIIVFSPRIGETVPHAFNGAVKVYTTQADNCILAHAQEDIDKAADLIMDGINTLYDDIRDNCTGRPQAIRPLTIIRDLDIIFSATQKDDYTDALFSIISDLRDTYGFSVFLDLGSFEHLWGLADDNFIKSYNLADIMIVCEDKKEAYRLMQGVDYIKQRFVDNLMAHKSAFVVERF